MIYGPNCAPEGSGAGSHAREQRRRSEAPRLGRLRVVGLLARVVTGGVIPVSDTGGEAEGVAVGGVPAFPVPFEPRDGRGRQRGGGGRRALHAAAALK